jgi:hypothetical protein
MEKLASSHDLLARCVERVSPQELQTDREFKLRVEFGERSECDADMAEKRSLSSIGVPFGDVARNRRGGAPNLRTELEPCTRRKCSRKIEGSFREIHGGLPHF